jgi:hypothetical protein
VYHEAGQIETAVLRFAGGDDLKRAETKEELLKKTAEHAKDMEFWTWRRSRWNASRRASARRDAQRSSRGTPHSGKKLGLRPLLAPLPSGETEAYEVSTFVNSPRNDSPECVRRVFS